MKEFSKDQLSFKKELFFENLYKRVIFISAIIFLLLIIGFLITLLLSSIQPIKSFGFKFIFGKTWDPVFNEFGALPFVVGTFMTSFLALTISLPFSLALSILLGEYMKEGFLSTIFKSVSEILAGIPSVIYGMWGLFLLVPLVRGLEIKLRVPPYGVGIFTSSIILSIMILPYSASMGREVIALVPTELKEAAYSLGATRFEVIKKVIIPYVRSGIFAGILLSLGRALGETMAVTMVIGNRNELPDSIFSPANTMASLIANEFSEAVGDLHLFSLIEIGFLLFLITFFVNLMGRAVIKRI